MLTTASLFDKMCHHLYNGIVSYYAKMQLLVRISRLCSVFHCENNKIDEQQKRNDATEDEDLRKKWEKSRKENNKGNKFLELMDTYIESYLNGERGIKGSHTRIDMENLVSNHSKWHRMMNHRGQGRQYRDDMRRVCFVFHLSFYFIKTLFYDSF